MFEGVAEIKAVMKEDVDTLKNDWLTDNVWTPAPTAVNRMADISVEYSVLGGVRNPQSNHHCTSNSSWRNSRISIPSR